MSLVKLDSTTKVLENGLKLKVLQVSDISSVAEPELGSRIRRVPNRAKQWEESLRTKVQNKEARKASQNRGPAVSSGVRENSSILENGYDTEDMDSGDEIQNNGDMLSIRANDGSHENTRENLKETDIEKDIEASNTKKSLRLDQNETEIRSGHDNDARKSTERSTRASSGPRDIPRENWKETGTRMSTDDRNTKNIEKKAEGWSSKHDEILPSGKETLGETRNGSQQTRPHLAVTLEDYPDEEDIHRDPELIARRLAEGLTSNSSVVERIRSTEDGDDSSTSDARVSREREEAIRDAIHDTEKALEDSQRFGNESGRARDETPQQRQPVSPNFAPKSKAQRRKEKRQRSRERFSSADEGTDDEASERPFKNVKSVRWALDKEEAASLAEKSARTNWGPDFVLRSKLSDGNTVEDLTERALDATVNIRLRELMDVSPKISKKVKERLTKTRVSQVNLLEQTEEVLSDHSDITSDEEFDDGLPLLSRDPTDLDMVDIRDLPQAQFHIVTAGDASQVYPEGSVIMDDVVLQYLAEVTDPQALKLVVANDSESLKVVRPMINSAGHEECVLDWGSQIVSMAQATAESLMISWDPSVCIYMQSAGGSLDRSLGIAKNVPFHFGDITVYLQVHILPKPAYKVLLGRPFEVVTGCTTQSTTENSQTIRITCPNTKRKQVVPTQDRTVERKIISSPAADFRKASMI